MKTWIFSLQIAYSLLYKEPALFATRNGFDYVLWRLAELLWKFPQAAVIMRKHIEISEVGICLK